MPPPRPAPTKCRVIWATLTVVNCFPPSPCMPLLHTAPLACRADLLERASSYRSRPSLSCPNVRCGGFCQIPPESGNSTSRFCSMFSQMSYLLPKYRPRLNMSIRYFNPYRLNSDASSVAHSSYDTTLTVFAQLRALRLNGRRCMISLFDRSQQYIIAEATRTLSLIGQRY